MTVITRSRTDNYAVVPNSVTEDNRLSFEARGVLCYLLAKPNNWQVQIADLQKQGSFGRDKAYRILKELREVGYLALEVKRNDKAQIISQDYIVYDVAELSQKLLTEKPDTAEPDMAEPDMAEPDTANTDGIINNKNITNTHSFSDTNVSSKQNARDKERLEAEFHETFWPAFPNKVGKPKALISFLKARKKDNLENIMAGLNRYIADKPPDRQWLNPTTFLNQERWNDQPAPIQERNYARTNTDSRSTGQKVADAMRRLAPRFDAYQAERAHERGLTVEVQGRYETHPFPDGYDQTDDRGGKTITLVASNSR